MNDDNVLKNNNMEINMSNNYKDELENLVKEYPADKDNLMDLE